MTVKRVVIIACIFSLSVCNGDKIDHLTELSCRGDLWSAYHFMQSDTESASKLHILSCLEFVLNGDCIKAVELHKKAKALESTRIPPLAKLHLDGVSCNGLSDIFYISAVTIKKLVDTNLRMDAQLTGHTTMITLLSDSGLNQEAETHLNRALTLNPNDSSLLIRSTLMTPAVFSSQHELDKTRHTLQSRLGAISALENLTLTSIDEFVLSPTFYLVYQGHKNDAAYLSNLHRVYSLAFPKISAYPSPPPLVVDAQPSKTMRIGFYSAHFRRHSICKLFCGIIEGLTAASRNQGLALEVFAFSSLSSKQEDALTSSLESKVKEVVRLPGGLNIANRAEVTSRNIDLFVYLDVGMDPSTVVWSASKLAPVQLALWGHPVSTGLASIDYFVSSSLFHEDAFPSESDSLFSEQLLRMDSLGFFFRKPTLPPLSHLSEEDHVMRPPSYYEALSKMSSSLNHPSMQKLLHLKMVDGAMWILLPQHLPKFHPSFDCVLRHILHTVPNSFVAITIDPKRSLWRKTLEKRWMLEANFTEDMVHRRVLWLEQLSPDQYLTLLAVGDVMLDQFPFGGGVTVLESLSVLTPVITCPSLQTVPSLAGGMLRSMFPGRENDQHALRFIVPTSQAYADSAVRLLLDNDEMQTSRRLISEHSAALYNDEKSIDEWATFVRHLAKN